MTKLVRKGSGGHSCFQSLHEFEVGTDLDFGTVVQCGCGKHWKLRRRMPFLQALLDTLWPSELVHMSRGWHWWLRVRR